MTLELNLSLVWGPDALRSWVSSRSGSATCCGVIRAKAQHCSVPQFPQLNRGVIKLWFGPCSSASQSHGAPVGWRVGWSQLHPQKGQRFSKETGKPGPQVTPRAADPAPRVWSAFGGEAAGANGPGFLVSSFL